jgi:O-antigen ligase
VPECRPPGSYSSRPAAMASTDLERAPGLTVLDLAPPPASTVVRREPRSLTTYLRVAIGLFLVANLGRIPVLFVGNKDAPILATDLGIAAIAFAAAWIALRYRTLRIDGIAAGALVFAGIGALSAVLAVPRFGLSPFQLAISLAYLFRWLAYFSLYLVVINFVRRHEVPDVWRALQVVVLAFATFGIFQSIFLPGFAQMVDPGSELYLDWDPQGHRLVSTFLDPNLAGGLIMIGLLVMLALVSFGERVAPWKLGVLVTAIVLTVSRSSILGLLVGSLVIVAARGLSRRLVRVGAVIAVLVLPFVPLILRFAGEYGRFTLEGSALARVVMWARAIEIIVDNPVLGVGFNTYGFVQEAYGYEAVGRASFTLDGGLLFAAVMTGMVGLAVYCTMLWLLVRRCRRIWRDPKREGYDRGLALGVASATVGLLVHSAFLNSLFFPFLMGPLWVLWGLVFLVRHPPAADRARRRLQLPSPIVARGWGWGR